MSDMPFTISPFLDHGTQNPIVARLAVQTLGAAWLRSWRVGVGVEFGPHL